MSNRIKYMQDLMEKKKMLIAIAPAEEKVILQEEMADMEVTLRLFEVTLLIHSN